MGLVEDVQVYLAAQNLIDGATGWPSVRRRVFDGLGDRLVVITEDGGAQPELPADAGIGDAAFEDPAVQIRVRGEPWDSDASYDKARAIAGALHGLYNVPMNGTTYLRVGRQSVVFNAFDDDKSRPNHTISIRAATAVSAP
jgi:hypothetical protein